MRLRLSAPLPIRVPRHVHPLPPRKPADPAIPAARKCAPAATVTIFKDYLKDEIYTNIISAN
jgi:hypothetical protein